ncbi:unnamed protein product [Callosobruchus maculatus]|uniref:C2H2-type domain-containing protein n=1 Tax=Callosobruchus maculatus TaxID=64391 RepID=A0A653BU19_CALMS|nr:unnamed protein product [Callosobruchus maculatus]
MSFQCDFCLKKLQSRGSWKVHRKRHLQEFVAKCEECDRGFVTNQEYHNHLGAKHGTSRHICNVCGRACYDKAALQNHMARHADNYTTNTDIKCELCGKTFLQERYLRHHHSRMHQTDGGTHVCDHCGKTVSSKRSLRDHLLIHEGLKPIECKECGRGFALRTTLKLHMRTHTGDRPYKCTLCSKSFTQKTPLTVHMRIHTGERPYLCIFCDSSFVSKGALQVHQKKHQESPVLA